MDRLSIETTDTPVIKISKIAGSLRIKGWDRPEVRADSDQSDTLSLEQKDNEVMISCKSGCMLRAPTSSTIVIGNVDRDLMIKSIECEITAEKVNGQVMVKSVGPLSVANIGGHFNAKHVEGSVTCQSISGNTTLQDVEGNIQLDAVHGNLTIQGFSVNINAKTHGNAVLKLEPEPDSQYHVEAFGNIICRLSPDTNAVVNLASKTQNIHIKTAETTEILKTKEHQITLGNGTGMITLEAKGNIDLSTPSEYEFDDDFEFDIPESSSLAGDISQMVSGQIEAQMDALTHHINQLTANINVSGSVQSEKIRRKMEAKRIELERKLAKVGERAEQRARMADKRIQHVSKRYQMRSNKPPIDPVTEEERQKVLEMLQNKLISVADAELLLATLEGRQPDLPSSQSEEPAESE